MNILTFDLEDWFHLLDHPSTKTEQDWLSFESRFVHNVERVLEILEHKKQKATFFCLGWSARKYPGIINKISRLGHDIASHSDMHQLIYEQSARDFEEDIIRSIRSLEDIIGKKVRAYRAPGFSLNEASIWALEILIRNGIEIDCSIFPARRAHGGFTKHMIQEPLYIEIHGNRIKEFPMNTYKNIVFSGGGYFRLLPYRLIRFMMLRSQYVMTYFHPKEFDILQPRLEDLSCFRKFKSYYGVASALNKFSMLLHDFEFIDLQTADRLISWNSARTIKL